jgi:hypothetical protein
MPHSLSRRQFLRSAGGITFLALSPVGRGLFAATDAPVALPLFTALPYVQPGPNGQLKAGAEAVRLAWQTEPREADFTVEFGRDDKYGRTAAVARTQRSYPAGVEPAGRYNYVVTFEQLDLATEYHYRVKGNGTVIATGYFTTRQPRGGKIRFAAFGDNCNGDPSDHAIAYQVYQAHPDFVMNTGDNVYENGLDSQYSNYFFPIFNADVAALDKGGPLLRSVPFYTVIANHDLNTTDPVTKHPCANFDLHPDALAYYTNFHLPLNGPKVNHPTTTRGDAARLADFQACAGERFPRMANYSYDYGDAHFLCLDANTYVDATDEDLQAWVKADLAATDAKWKIIVYHQPAFNAGAQHYKEQQMRPLCPLFEAHGVDLVLSGHEHIYQRNRPLTFAPGDLTRARVVFSSDRLVPGKFTLDLDFDGEKVTKPKGILYITTGAGGKKLYDPGFTDAPAKWLHKEDNNEPYAVKMNTDKYSFSLFEIDGGVLTMRQIDQNGVEIDRMKVTKS